MRFSRCQIRPPPPRCTNPSRSLSTGPVACSPVPAGNHAAVNQGTEWEQEQIELIRRLHAQGLSQNRIIEQLFGCRKGGSRVYHEARDLYRQVIHAMAPAGTGEAAREPAHEADEET